MYSPLAARALPATSNSKSNRESRRIPPISRSTIYAQREAVQAVAVSLCEGDPDTSKHVRCAPPTGRRLQQFDVITKQVLPGLAFSDQRELVAAKQCFRWQRTRIVIGRHHKSVSTRAHNRQQILFMYFRHLAIQREKIARFAHRPYDVDLLCLILILILILTGAPARNRLFQRYNLVIATVQRR